MFFGAYWSRQITDAPTIEMAIGMKTSDLAMFSHRPARWESTAILRPSTVAPIVTVNIHQIVLENASDHREEGERQKEEADRHRGPRGRGVVEA